MADTDQTTDQTTDATSDDSATTTDQLGDAGKAALDKERQARKEAEKRAKEAEKRIADFEAAQKSAADEDAKRKGEFEKLANDRQATIDALTTEKTSLAEERDALLAKVQAYEDRDRKTIADGVTDLPDDLKAFDPGDDAPLAARMDWFTKARAIAAKRTTDPQPGNGRSPEAANGRDPKADEAARAVFAQRYE